MTATQEIEIPPPSPDDVRHARRVIEAMGDGTGAVMLDGKMEDDASVKQWVLELVGRSAGSPQIVYLTDDPDVAAWARMEALSGELAIIDMQDHGAGVPPDMIEQLLKPFTRMDSARGQANGAGLGLAIVQRVVTRHGAELNVSNRPAGGLRIEIIMPLAEV